MKGYKAFNKGLVCKDFQYEEGQIYEIEGKLIICNKGFHFCENPLDVLNYYDLCESEFSEVEALGDCVSDKNNKDTKVATNKIKIGAKLDLKGFINASIGFLFEKCKNEESNEKVLASSGYSSKLASSGHSSKLASSGDSSQLASSGHSSQLASSGDYSQLASSGHYSKLASSGHYSKLASSGDSSQLASSGHYSQLASSGDSSQLASSGYSSKLASSGDSSQLASSGHYSQLASSGDSSQLASSGHYSQLASSGHSSKLASSGHSSQLDLQSQYSVGAGIGFDNKIKGKKGNWITLAEWIYDNNLDRCIPICVKSAQIDGEILKEDTWYQLKNSEFVEVE